MADDITMSAGTADGAVVATDDDGTRHHPYVKLEFGADNTQTKVSGANPLPVQISDGTDTALVDGSGNLQVVVGGTVTVGSHAVTNAGTFAVQENGSHVQVDDAAFTPATSKVVMVGAEFDDTLPDSVDEGDGGALRMSANRNLFVTLRDAAGNERGLNVDANGAIAITDGAGTITVDNAGLTELAAAINASSQLDVNIAASNASVAVTNAGITTIAGAVSGTEMQVDVLTSALPTGAATAAKQPALGTAGTASSDVITVQGIASMTALKVDGSGVTQPVSGTVTANLSATDNAVLDAIAASLALLDNAIPSGNELQVDVVGALPAGTNAIGKLAANSGVDIGDVDILSIAAGTNSIGNVGLVPRTSGGMTIFKSIDIDETEEQIKASAGQVFSISAFNHTAAPLYLKFYNATAANVTVGTTAPVLTFTVPGNADSDGAGFVWNNTIGFAFGTAITVACTGAIADNDATAPAANACSVMVGYA